MQEATCEGWRLPGVADLFADAAGVVPWWQKKNRLGHHFEHIHARLLAAQAGVVIHALNVSLQGTQQTLGEVDCLYSNADGEVIHREIAIKYFLGFHESPEARNWIGTTKVDRLDLKVQRMALHQTQVATLAQQQGVWPASLPFPTRREVLMLGAFFRHTNHAAWPTLMGKTAEGGFWCSTEEFVRLAGATSVWACLQKPWWLSPQHRLSAPQMSALQVAADVDAQQHPLLVAALDPSTEKPINGRGFVVPRGWHAED